MPAGASAYLEVSGLGERVGALWDSPLADSMRKHPAMVKFMASPEGQQFKMGQGMPPGANTTGQLHPHHTGMGMQGQVIGNSSNQTQANITGLSHPSTATH